MHSLRRRVADRRWRAAPALAACLIAGGALPAGLNGLHQQQAEAQRWVDHTVEMLGATAGLAADMARASSDGRGYIVDRTQENYERFGAGAARVRQDIRALRALAADNPAQLAALSRLEPLAEARLAVMRSIIEKLRAGDDSTLLEVLRTHAGRLLGDKASAVLGEIESEERRLLAARREAVARAGRRTLLGLAGCAAAMAAGGLGAVWLLAARRRQKADRVRLEDEVRARTAELADASETLDALFLNASDALLIARVDRDADGRPTFRLERLNPAGERFMGCSATDAAGLPPSGYLPPAEAEAGTAHWLDCAASRGPVAYSVVRGPETDRRDWDVAVAPVLDADGSVRLLIKSARDVTGRNQLEQARRQSHRLEGIAQITAGVAHDFNNLLQTVQGGLQVLAEQPGLDHDGRESAELAAQAARRGATLVRRLLAFSRQQPLNPAPLRPGDVLAGARETLVRTLGTRLRIDCRAANDVWRVRADAAGLDDCLLSLAFNASDAMAGGGALRMRAANAGPEEATGAGLPPGDYVRFAVEDDGPGIPPDLLARVLEPFFTTKPVGRGAGLGLSMVQGFARQSGGDLRLDSRVGQGTRAGLWLPRATGPDAAPAADAAPGGRARVLIVDDEETVQRMMALFLSRAGFAAEAAEDAETALERLRQGAPCDLLITDQSMPGMSGCELIEAVAALRPDLPAMIVTGYDRVSGLDRLGGKASVLRKPFDARDFVAEARRLLPPPPAALTPAALTPEAAARRLQPA